MLFLFRTILSRKFTNNVWWCTLFTDFNSSLKTKEILSLLLIRLICLNSCVLEAAFKRYSMKNISTTPIRIQTLPTYTKLLLLKDFRRKYLYVLMATLGISKKLVSTLKQYCEKKLSLIKTMLKHVCF